MRRLIVWAVVAVSVLLGADAAAAAPSADPVLELSPAAAAPGESVAFTVATTCRDGESIGLSIKGGEVSDNGNAYCTANAFHGRMTAPTTPGSYAAWAVAPNFTIKALLTVVPTGGGDVCDQAIAEAGSGRGAFGDHELVSAPRSGGSGDQVIVGTAGNDRLDGGSGSDVLCGLGGDDVLVGGSGDDAIYGGEGADRLNGGAGDDSLDGGGGTDVLSGGSGDDILLGGETVDEGSGADFTVGATSP